MAQIVLMAAVCSLCQNPRLRITGGSRRLKRRVSVDTSRLSFTRVSLETIGRIIASPLAAESPVKSRAKASAAKKGEAVKLAFLTSVFSISTKLRQFERRSGAAADQTEKPTGGCEQSQRHRSGCQSLVGTR